MLEGLGVDVCDVLGESHRGTVPAVETRLHLVRHGEVHNPGHICYADLISYNLLNSQ